MEWMLLLHRQLLRVTEQLPPAAPVQFVQPCMASLRKSTGRAPKSCPYKLRRPQMLSKREQELPKRPSMTQLELQSQACMLQAASGQRVPVGGKRCGTSLGILQRN